MLNVENATTKELVAYYNEHAEKPVKKFADRKTAERRVNELIASMDKPIAQVRSEAIAKSWEKPEVKAKRRQRSAVKVDGVEYRSVRAAFGALKLPLNEHIAFRMQLKSDGKTKCYDRQWEIIPQNY